MKLVSLMFAAMMALASADADAARRLGGGGSVGKQSSNVTQREAGGAPAQPGGAAAQKAPAQQQQAAPGTAAQPQPKRGFMGGMLGGLAAGLGIAWLAHALGFGEGFSQFVLILLLVVVVMAVIGFIRARRAAPAAASGSPFAFQSAGPAPEVAPPPPQYNPDKVGNDASARPWERSSMAFESAKYGNTGSGSGLKIGSALEGAQTWGIPPGFDTEGFIAAAKRNFVTLQDAWDKAEMNALRSMMTDEMVREIGGQLAERAGQGGPVNRTEVVMLEAQLLGIEDLGDDYMASVEFSGMIREEPSAGPSPFREVWNMTKPKSGSSGWLVAGVQALQ